MCGCLSHAPHNREPGPQPSHVPRLGIKPATLWFAGQHSIHWAIPARAADISLCVKMEYHYHNNFVLLHTLLWPFLNKGRENLPSHRKLIFINVSILDILAYFMVSSFKLLYFQRIYYLFFCFKCNTVHNYTRDI